MLLLAAFALYDSMVRGLTLYSVNLDIFYFCSVYGFILFTMISALLKARLRRDQLMILALSLPIALRLILNLVSINREYEDYARIVNSLFIDHLTWVVLSIVILVALWQKSIASRP